MRLGATILLLLLLCGCQTPRGAALREAAATAAARCDEFAADELAAGGADAFGIPLSGFRFGHAVDAAALRARPDVVDGWCKPPAQVNCGKWDDAPGRWRAPAGCACYAEGRGRSYENCNDGDLFACPWASGSGCGLHFLGELGGEACAAGPDAAAPQVNSCFFDVVGTTHDSCCAKHYYADRRIVFEGRNIAGWECNGCNGGRGLPQCAARPLGIRVPKSDGLPCRQEWELSVAHNRLEGEIRYQWHRPVDTEQRFTAAEVAQTLGRPDALIARARPEGDHFAATGQVLLKIDDAAGLIGRDEAARFCRSGSVHVEEIRVGLLRTRDAWVCD